MKAMRIPVIFVGHGSPMIALEALAGKGVKASDSWGIDHGSWSVLRHIFPAADIPVVQLSLSAAFSPREHYEAGRLLSGLREQGFLIFASGNIVHNLREVDWNSDGGSPECVRFNDLAVNAVLKRDDEALVDFRSLPDAAYAAPTPEHFIPLLYALGAGEGESPRVFNNKCELGAIAMSSFAFGM